MPSMRVTHSHRRRYLFFQPIFFKEIPGNMKSETPKKFEIPGFLKKHILELSPRLSPHGILGCLSFPKKLGQHRTMGTAGFGGSFAPIVQHEKWEIHPVFPHFSYFRLCQNLSPNLLAPLCGAALEKGGASLK